MRQQRQTAEEAKEHLLSVMREVHAQVTSQSEFTAQRVADAAGISKVWLYHIAGEEFRTLRAELPGSRKTRDEEVATLRQENAQLREQLKAAQERARLTSSTALKKAMVMLEQWEQENLELRGHIRVLSRRLEQTGGYVDIDATASQLDHKSHLKPVDS
jgi:hypothetical protein